MILMMDTCVLKYNYNNNILLLPS